MKHLIELRSSAEYKLHFDRELFPGEKRELGDALGAIEAEIEKLKAKGLKRAVVYMKDLVIYNQGKKLTEQMTRPSFMYEIGMMKKQYAGEDVAMHGRTMYETISEIENLDTKEIVVINDYERNEYLKKDFCKVNELESAVQKQNNYLEAQIEMYQEMQRNLINNYNKVVESLKQLDLELNKEHELEEIER